MKLEEELTERQRKADEALRREKSAVSEELQELNERLSAMTEEVRHVLVKKKQQRSVISHDTFSFCKQCRSAKELTSQKVQTIVTLECELAEMQAKVRAQEEASRRQATQYDEERKSLVSGDIFVS